MAEFIEIQITPEEFKEALKKVLNKDHQQILPEVIEQITKDNNFSRELIMKACLGIKHKLKYAVEDLVLVNQYVLSNWLWDRSKMESQGLLNDNCVQCRIVDINLYSREAYKVEYKYISPDTDKIRLDYGNVSENNIRGYIEPLL